MAMTRRTSICLSLVALLSSFPVSLADASHESGSSLIGVSTVAEILDQFFAKQEMHGGKAPAWKREAQAMISMVESMKNMSINATTQARVDGFVQKILEELRRDQVAHKAAQGAAQRDLEDWKNDAVTPALQSLSTQLGRVKTRSGKSKECRDNVTTQTTEYLGTHGCTNSYLPSAAAGLSTASLIHGGAFRSQSGTCPTECGKPSTAQFELTAEAKQKETCKFEEGETAKQCVGRLWAKVNMTRQNLTNKYNAWSTKKSQCEAEMAQCAKCNPLWGTLQVTNQTCDDKKKELYDAYCDLQTKQSGFCSKNDTLFTRYNEALPGQDNRTERYIMGDFLICIFEKYYETKNFTVAMIGNCPKKVAQDFYSVTEGQLTLPTVDASAVPACYGAVSHSATSPLFDMTGLINEVTYDNYATTVSVADHMYAPAAESGSVFCTALAQ